MPGALAFPLRHARPRAGHPCRNGGDVRGGEEPEPFARRLNLPDRSGLDSRVCAFAPLRLRPGMTKAMAGATGMTKRRGARPPSPSPLRGATSPPHSWGSGWVPSAPLSRFVVNGQARRDMRASLPPLRGKVAAKRPDEGWCVERGFAGKMLTAPRFSPRRYGQHPSSAPSGHLLPQGEKERRAASLRLAALGSTKWPG